MTLETLVRVQTVNPSLEDSSSEFFDNSIPTMRGAYPPLDESAKRTRGAAWPICETNPTRGMAGLLNERGAARGQTAKRTRREIRQIDETTF